MKIRNSSFSMLHTRRKDSDTTLDSVTQKKKIYTKDNMFIYTNLLRIINCHICRNFNMSFKFPGCVWCSRKENFQYRHKLKGQKTRTLTQNSVAPCREHRQPGNKYTYMFMYIYICICMYIHMYI